MPRVSLVPCVAAILFAVALAGCTDDDAPEKPTTPTPAPVTAANNTTLGAIDAPVWKTGQWWAHHTSIGPDDPGEHFNVFVIATDAGGYDVGTSSEELAMREAESDVFDVGSFGADLSTTHGRAPWKWYEWPLADNKSWEQSVVVDGVAYHARFTATYDPDVEIAGGTREGFAVAGVTEDNFTIMTYDYVEEMGWFSSLDLYDPAVGGDAPAFNIRSMGAGTGATYTFVEYSIQDLFHYSNSINSSLPTGDLVHTFNVPEGISEIRGTVVVAAETGHAVLRVTDSGTNVYEWTATAPGETVAEPVVIDRPPAGEWRLAFAGVGPSVWTVLDLKAVAKTTGEL